MATISKRSNRLADNANGDAKLCGDGLLCRPARSMFPIQVLQYRNSYAMGRRRQTFISRNTADPIKLLLREVINRHDDPPPEEADMR